MSEWNTVVIGCYVELINGFAFPSTGFTEEEGMPLIRIRDLNRCDTEVNFRGKYPERYVVKKGDLLIGMDGDFSTIRWKGNDALLNQRICKLVTKDSERLVQDFLFYRITEEIAGIHRITAATTVKHLSSKDILEIEVKLPSSPEQTEIAKILSTVDQAIERTEALISKQQRIKTGLMQDLLTRGIDEDGNLRSEDTHEFKDSPLGRIPVEWEMRPLGRLAKIDRGKFTHRPRNDPRFYGGSYPFIQTGDVTSRAGRVINSCSQTLNERGTTICKRFPAGTIAISIAANIADSAILGIPMYFPDSVVGAVVSSPNDPRFIELMIRRWKPVLERLAPQSAQKNINLEILKPLPIPTPSPDEQIRISSLCGTVDWSQEQMEQYRNKLSSLKNGLMQDLLTGKRRVNTLQLDV